MREEDNENTDKKEDRKPEKVRHRELVDKIAQNTRTESDDIGITMKALPFALIDSLTMEGDRVYIFNFGTFSVEKRTGKRDCLSASGKANSIKMTKRRDKLYIKFTPSKNFIPYSEQDIRDEKSK